ncbi:MAG TPA: protease inhibitor I42 family protein [Vitreimonas sp.]|jgi:predicted secreted protein|nr:protease inhibitor I42 family protein [Vitreimonas sp.]
MKFRTALVAAALLGACAPTTTSQAPDAQPQQQQSVDTGMLPAPTPADVTVHINSAQEGQVVQVGVNQRFAIELVGVPTAGYQWAPAQLPPFIVRAGDASGPTIAAQNQPGYAGGNHWEVNLFAATGPGTGEIVMEQRRPWETSEPPAHVFRVTVVAR